MKDFGSQMDLPGFFEEPERVAEENDIKKEAQEPIAEPEKITPMLLGREEFESDCPLCGGSGPCYVCERGRQQTLEWKKRQTKISRSQIPRRKKAI